MSKSEISKEKPENSKIFTIIESLCKEAGVSVTRVCTDITGNKGNLPTWKKGNINTTSLIKLTEYFNVSADYLLGRTDAPQENTINNQNATITDSVQAIKSPVTINSSKENKDTDKDDEQLLEMIKSLNLVERSKIIVMIDDMRKGA